jgi:uncharacterized protein (DUF486 family)
MGTLASNRVQYLDQYLVPEKIMQENMILIIKITFSIPNLENTIQWMNML